MATVFRWQIVLNMTYKKCDFARYVIPLMLLHKIWNIIDNGLDFEELRARNTRNEA